MNKSLLSLSIMLSILSVMNAQTPASNNAGFNFSSFTSEKKNITDELQSLTDPQFYSHPEYGMLPYNAPCKDCFELLQKRDETHRYFVRNGTHGKEFYQQTSYGALNYEENGVLRTIDARLSPAMQQGVFKAGHQPFPVTINIPERFTSIVNAGKELKVNSDGSLFVMHSDGSTTSLGEPDWTNYAAGNDGIVVHNFYPGIDLELRVGGGNIESFYRINKPLNISDGWLVIRDNMKVPGELVLDYSKSERSDNNFYGGTLFINDKSGTHYFYIGAPAAYDENNEQDNAINLNYHVADNGTYDIYVPVGWMNDAKRSYPLVIDPLVSVTSTLAAANITNSGYSDTCFANGCTYLLNVSVPPAACITDIHTTFWFRALASCPLYKGAWDILYKSCRFPNTGSYNECSIALPGLCQLTNLDCYTSFSSCLPAASCNPTPLPFTLEFYRCTEPGGDCSTFSCITSDVATPTPWSVTVTGFTDTIGTITASHDTTICSGSSAILNVNLSSNICIPPFNYLWRPGGLTGSQVTVSPTATTTYSVLVTSCDSLDSASAIVTVTVDTCTGIMESYLSDHFNVYPNPSQGSITIQSDIIKSGSVNADIYDMLGKKIYSLAITGEEIRKGYRIDFNSSSSGLYLLVFQIGDAIVSKKISIEK